MTKVFGSIVMVGVMLIAFGGANAGDDGGKKKGGKGGGLFGKGNVEEMFKKLDTDKDMKLSKTEFLKIGDQIAEKIGEEKAAKIREFIGKAFDKIAVDGVVTLDQLKKAGSSFEGFKKKKKDDA